MKKITFFKVTLILAMSISALAKAQNTYNMVYNVFQANCVSCHNSTNLSGSLDLGASDSAVYADIVNVNPVNATALAKANKLVSPGDPHRSFLLRKCINGLDADNGITTGEGAACPQNSTSLSNKEIELIRQWIYAGAPETGNVVDTAIINKYYNGYGIDNTPPSHPLPTDPGSFQVHIGKVFLDVLSETEYYLKYDLKLPDSVDVNRIEVFMPSHSHHFLIYKFEPGTANGFADGIRTQNPITGAGSSSGNNTLVSAWQFSADISLPAGTAYLWETSAVLDFNHHFFNSNSDSVVGTDVYMNIYTQPKHTAPNRMYSNLITNTNIFIYNNSSDFTFTKEDHDPNETAMWNLWLLSSHTHKYGKDFDIYKRNPDGSKGAQVFEGFYNTDYTINQGYYDWEHPPVKIMDPMIQIDPRDGLIQEATFNNNGPLPVAFGLTTKDEMMLYFIQYTRGNFVGTSIKEEKNTIQFSVSPNPYKYNTQISYQLKEQAVVSVEIYDMLGKNILTLADKDAQSSGNYKYDFNTLNTPAGLYFAKVTVNGAQFTKRIIQIK